MDLPRYGRVSNSKAYWASLDTWDFWNAWT